MAGANNVLDEKKKKKNTATGLNAIISVQSTKNNIKFSNQS